MYRMVVGTLRLLRKDLKIGSEEGGAKCSLSLGYWTLRCCDEDIEEEPKIFFSSLKARRLPQDTEQCTLHMGNLKKQNYIPSIRVWQRQGCELRPSEKDLLHY